MINNLYKNDENARQFLSVKFLNDKTLGNLKVNAGFSQMTKVELVAENTNSKAEYGDQLEKTIQIQLGYYVSLRHLNITNCKL